jgi:hypothetical protein
MGRVKVDFLKLALCFGKSTTKITVLPSSSWRILMCSLRFPNIACALPILLTILEIHQFLLFAHLFFPLSCNLPVTAPARKWDKEERCLYTVCLF